MEKNYKYHDPFITIWHEDPETDGSDDSCGFGRPRIPKYLIEEAKREAKSECAEHGLFPFCKPRYDPTTTILGIFNLITWRLFRKDITPKQMVKMINVCVDPVDNLRHCVETEKQEDVENLFFLCLRFYMKITRPWYKHPRWHIHHWRFQIHPWQKIRRYLFERCEICKKGFRWREGVAGFGNGIAHLKCCGMSGIKETND
jgi:hypothetical protein